MGISISVVLAFAAGCDGPRPNPPKPAGSGAKPATPAARLTLLKPESLEWSRDQAAEFLAEDDSRMSAALRLVQLQEPEALCRPARITDDTVRKLRLVPLGPSAWTVGFVVADHPRLLRAPVVVTSAGEAWRTATGAEEETALLVLSADADVFPHVVLTPVRVVLLDPQPVTAVERKAQPHLSFAWADAGGLPYVALRIREEMAGREIARYTWDPYELQFTGPARDRLQEGREECFELILPNSKRLVPRGGIIPKPEPTESQPEHDPSTRPAWELPEGDPT